MTFSLQALKFIGNKIRTRNVWVGSKKTKVDEARDVLHGVVLAHVPVSQMLEDVSCQNCLANLSESTEGDIVGDQNCLKNQYLLKSYVLTIFKHLTM